MMEQELRVRVLGGAELAVSGRPLVELASAKAAALVVYLAVTGTGHSRSALAGLLWSDLPEATARANLRLVLTKLRRVLPEHLEVTRQTVALAPGRPVWVDAVEVARVTAGERDGGELLAAVRLCRGDFLEGFGVPGAPLFDEWLVGRRAAVRADMLALMDRAVALARDRGDAATGIEVGRRMLELEPLHEEAHRALMWFLATGGQRSAALAQYETCCYMLREELGIEPSAATVTLRDEIAGAGEFTELGARQGTGVAGREAAPPATTAAPAPDLPRPLTTLVGRERELARLHELLEDPACRLVTLVGPGGIGKTRLALEVAATRHGRHRDGAVFVSFVGTGPARPEEAADLVVADLARALEVSLAVPRDPLELLADHLSGRELLLVLDNLEQLRDAAGVLAELLRRAPGVQLLVTSRRRLGLGVEWLVEVPGLPYPPAEAGADAAGYEAVQLFAERARLLRPGFPADAEGAGRVCRLLAGVPLAIELAARWVRSASPAAIADRVAGGLDLLDTTSPDVELRHRSVRAVIDWSWQLLTEGECRALRRLSVLRGGFDLEAAAAVAGAGLPLLAGLVDQSLVAAGEDGRYDMHELLRQYAAERLAADPAEEEDTRRRHAAHYAALLPVPAEALAGDGPGLDAEVENLRAATDWLMLAPAARRGAPAARRRGPGPAPPGAGAGAAGQPGAGVDGRLDGRARHPAGAPVTPPVASRWPPGAPPGPPRRGQGTRGGRLHHHGGLLGARGADPDAPGLPLGAERGRARRRPRPDRPSTGGDGDDIRHRRVAPAGGPSPPRRRRRRRAGHRPVHGLLARHRGRAPLDRGRRLGRGRGRRRQSPRDPAPNTDAPLGRRGGADRRDHPLPHRPLPGGDRRGRRGDGVGPRPP